MNLTNNKHLKEVEKVLDNWNVKEGYLTTNDTNGVDLLSEINIAELGLDTEDEDEIANLLEMHYDGSDYYFQHEKDNYYPFALVMSSCEEIFITSNNELVFPDNTANVKLSKDNTETEIIVFSLEWMLDNGCYPSIYQLDYYENSPEVYNFYETNEYKALCLSEDETKQTEEINRLVTIIEFQRYLEDNTQTLAEIPLEFYNKLPSVLQANDGYIEVLSVDSLDAYTMEIEFETEDIEGEELDELTGLIKKGILKEGSNDLSYIIKMSLITNSVRFIKELDEIF